MLKTHFMTTSRFASGLAALSLAAGASAAAGVSDDLDDAAPATPPGGQHFQVSYSGSVAIFKIADIQIAGEFAETTYQAGARFTAAGLAALFSDADIEAGVSGFRNGSDVLRPWRYSHLNHASSKNRIVGIDFPEGRAEPDINPPFGSMGEPPASDEEREGAIDPLSAFLSISLGAVATEDSLCEGRLPVFDGKARYDLRLEEGPLRSVRTRAWRGEAQVCYAYYEPVSGYDADEYPDAEEIAEPVALWMAPLGDGDIYVPVKIRANTAFGGITVSARSISTEPPEDGDGGSHGDRD